MNTFKILKKYRAYNRARLAIVARWVETRNKPEGSYAEGYHSGLDAAVKMIAHELGKK